MSLPVALTPDAIAALVNPRRTAGAAAGPVRDIASLTTAQPGDLTFLGNPRYRAAVPTTRASIVLLPEDYTGALPPDCLALFVANPSAALARICARLEPLLRPRPPAGVHPTAVIEPGATVAPTATVGPLCVVGTGATVGARTVLQAQVFLGARSQVGDDCWLAPGVRVADHCELRHRVRLHPGVVIGADGYGYEFVEGRHEKVPQIGSVLIEDDVEIGANTTIDRARFSRTVIGEGTKIDNLVQIGHNVTIGRHCLLCAQVGISGSTTLEDYVILAGQVGVGGHITLGRGTKAGGQAGITTDTAPGAYVNGTPALPYLLERRIKVLQQRLPDLFRRLENLAPSGK